LLLLQREVAPAAGSADTSSPAGTRLSQIALPERNVAVGIKAFTSRCRRNRVQKRPLPPDV